MKKVIGSLTLELHHYEGHFVSCLKLLLYCHVSSCRIIHYLGPLIQSSILTPKMVIFVYIDLQSSQYGF